MGIGHNTINMSTASILSVNRYHAISNILQAQKESNEGIGATLITAHIGRMERGKPTNQLTQDITPNEEKTGILGRDR